MIFFSRQNPAKWRFINQIPGSGSINCKISALRNSFFETTLQDFKVAIHLHYVFSKSKKIGFAKLQLLNSRSVQLPDFDFQHTSVKQYYDILRELNMQKHLGSCTVRASAKVYGHSIIVPHLKFVINSCIGEDVFPTELKKANVTLLKTE